MIQITLQQSLLQRLCIWSLLTAASLATLSLATLSLEPKARIKLLLVSCLVAQSVLLLMRATSSRFHPFFSPASYERLSLGSEFCSLESGGRWRRFQHPRVLYYSEFLIILKFIPALDEVSTGRHSTLRRWLGSHCLLLTPDSLTGEHDWHLRRHLHVLHSD